MAEFFYITVDTSGKKQKGTIESLSEKELIEYFRQNNVTVVKLTRKTHNFGLSFLKPGRVKSSDIVFFTRQLSSMIQTGITLLESLSIIRKQTTKPEMQRVVDDIIANISEGKSFSESLQNHPTLFTPVYIALIRAAEAGGLLDKILARLAENLEKSEDLKRRIKSAMFYPLIILIAVTGVITVMNVFVIPQLGTLYEQLNLTLPLPTRIVLGISALFTKFSPFLIAGVITGIFLFRKFASTETGKKTLDKFKLQIPILGDIVVLSILDEISRTLSLLIGSGASIIEALNITANVSGNVWYTAAIKAAATMVEKGITLSQAFDKQQIFPLTLIQMIKVGESTGRIDESLFRISQYYERDLDLKIKNLTTALEPIIIVTLGIIIGFIILAIITPIYSLVTSL